MKYGVRKEHFSVTVVACERCFMKKRNSIIKKTTGSSFSRRTVKQTAKFFVFLLVLLLLITEGLVCFFTMRSNAEKLYLSITKEVIASYSNNISTLISRFNADLMLFATAPVEDSREDIVDKMGKLQPMLANDILNVFYADDSGYGYQYNKPPVPIFDRIYYYEMIYNNKNYWLDEPVISKSFGVPIFHIAQSAFDKSGKKRGFFSISIPLKTIEDNIKETQFINKGNVFIIDTQGHFILRPQHSFISKNYKRSLHSDKNVDTLLDTMAMQMKGHLRFKGQDGKKYIVVYTPIKETPWSLAAIIPHSEILSSFSSVGYKMLFTLVIFTGLLISLYAVILLVVVFHKIYKVNKFNEPLDNLTGLWTLSRFEKEIQILLEKKHSTNYMVVSFDIQGLKFINQTYSEHVGNDMLILFSQNLANFAKKMHGHCARGYADHFYLIVPFKDRNECFEAFRQCFYSHRNASSSDVIPILVKSGIVFTGKDFGTESITDLLDKAAYARREIKGSYEREYLIFDESLNQKVLREKKIESCIFTAFDNREFYVVYQPKISISTGKVVGAEALVRWDSATLGKVMPDDFIPIFERNGSVVKLDFFVYESVFKFLYDNIKNNIPVVPISLNMSRLHTNTGAFLEMFDKLLKQYNIPPSLIEIEILERSVSRGNGSLKPVIEGLHDRGFHVSMDDFGTGESSLNMLDTIPVDTLKIDKNFLREQKDWETTKQIIMKIVELARDLKKTVVCEGVENKAQVEFLNSINCDIAQGFFYSKPLLSWELSEFLKKNVPLAN